MSGNTHKHTSYTTDLWTLLLRYCGFSWVAQCGSGLWATSPTSSCDLTYPWPQHSCLHCMSEFMRHLICDTPCATPMAGTASGMAGTWVAAAAGFPFFLRMPKPFRPSLPFAFGTALSIRQDTHEILMAESTFSSDLKLAHLLCSNWFGSR